MHGGLLWSSTPFFALVPSITVSTSVGSNCGSANTLAVSSRSQDRADHIFRVGLAERGDDGFGVAGDEPGARDLARAIAQVRRQPTAARLTTK
jgi:hypothetical protein